MAWSDAARKAAADARRLHGKAKKSLTDRDVADARTAGHVRKSLASDLKKLRAGQYKGDREALMRRAAASSAAMRRQRKGKLPFPGTGGMSNAEKARLVHLAKIRSR